MNGVYYSFPFPRRFRSPIIPPLSHSAPFPASHYLPLSFLFTRCRCAGLLVVVAVPPAIHEKLLVGLGGWCAFLIDRSSMVLLMVRSEHHPSVLRAGAHSSVEGGLCSAVSRGVLVIVVQEHCNPPREQWLTEPEAGAVSSLGRFALGCVSCVEADGMWLAVTKVGLQECVYVYLTGMPLHRSPGVPSHPPGPN
ncbi:hypothetical protein PILCRDRAFT_5412 [Piloderma croceum F 1598]|uniref:Uncharacterized protein n=1 Tax=Piloderma croceum (strain F 1598) TaxID=765440 RepID=A0A0C3BHH2_PILCF|nr:hypothetical protein PILCRDRAFT_5412 [Piloderma croceum F 1598]